jgi:transposase-like protein
MITLCLTNYFWHIYLYLHSKKRYGTKKCFYCGSKLLTKSGFQVNKQRYLCHACGKRFVFRKTVNKSTLWRDYIFDKQTYKELSDKYLISISSVQRRLKLQKTVRIISS